MGQFDFTPYAVGGATRPDSFTGMSPDFAAALAQLVQSAPKGYVQVSSGYRSPERQAQLWADALKKYGNPQAARKWVAPPGSSKHNHGQAADLKFMNDMARQWVHDNAKNYGLHFPLSNENWHVEPVGSRGGHQHAAPSTDRYRPVQAAPETGIPASGSALADAVVPPQAPAVDFGSVIAQFTQGRQQRAEAEAADKARKQALFGGGGLADLYA